MPNVIKVVVNSTTFFFAQHYWSSHEHHHLNQLSREQRMSLAAVMEAIRDLREFDFYG